MFPKCSLPKAYVYFVTRLKKNAAYAVIETTRIHYRKKDNARVLRDEIIEMEYHPEDESGKRLQQDAGTSPRGAFVITKIL